MSKKQNKKWTYKTLKESASKYSSVKGWRTAEQSAYVTAARLGLLPELTKNMKKKIVHGYWTEDRVLDSAKNYKHKSEWAKYESGAYNASFKLGINSKATAHMEIIGNRKLRCIYRISVTNTNFVYIGLTGNIKRRFRDHLKTKRFQKLATQYGTNNIICDQLTDYLPVEEAVHLEAQYVSECIIDGYELLNEAPTGSIGGITKKWSEEAILKNALKYKTVKNWIKYGKNSYAAAAALNIIDKASEHMAREIKKPGSWSRDEIILLAKKYRQISEWFKDDQKSYAAAQRLGLLRDPLVIGHFNKGEVVNRKWTVDTLREDARKYTTRSEWKKNSGGAFKAAKLLGCFDDLVRHMKFRPKPKPRWNRQSVIKDAKKYHTKPEWKERSGGAFQAAKKLRCFEEATKHMKTLNPKGKWASKAAIIEDALKYSRRSDWMKKSSGAYEAAKKLGCFEEATKHMPKRARTLLAQ